MANLIITVIAIALVAIASLMGAYYGGSAFLEGSAKAQAATIASQGQQIAAAWVLRANDNGNNYDTTVGAGGDLAATLVPSYLLEMPTPPTTASSGSFTAANLTDSTSTATYNGVRLSLATSATDVCRKIAQAVAGQSATLTAITGNSLNPAAGRRYDCVFVDNTPAGLGDEDTKTFVYKVR